MPGFLRRFKTVRLNSGNHIAELRVTPDYLAVGSDDDFFRIPMTPTTARRLADAWNCTLPTPRVVDAIYAQADLKLSPQPLTERREAVETFYEHHQLIERQRADAKAANGSLVAGIKKDVVISRRLLDKPGHVAIYGWHKLDGSPIQPLTTVHVEKYVDYSHGIRLVSQDVLLDGKSAKLDVILRDPQSCELLTDEGPTDVRGAYLRPQN